MAAAAVAPEHVLRLLHQLDTDLDELISLEDIENYVARHNLPFNSVELEGMFEEANSSRNGLMDVEQLTKAVCGKFSNRLHNEDWLRLFETAPKPKNWPANQPYRLTGIQEPMPQQQPIRSSYEQEDAILTFAPHTNSELSNSASRGTLTFPRGARTKLPSGRSSGAESPTSQTARLAADVPLLRPFAGSRPTPGEDADEMSINQLIAPPPQDDAAPDRARKVVRCGFEAKAAFDAHVARSEHASMGCGWRDRLDVPTPPPAVPPPLYYGVHPREFNGNTTLKNGELPLRADGVMTRVGKFVAPLRLLTTENSLVGSQNSATHKAWAMPEHGALSSAPFVSVFKKSSIQGEKMAVATDRLGQEGRLEYPPPNAYKMGKPHPYNFRDEIPKIDPRTLANGQPDFITAVGAFWPKNELRPPAVYATAPGEPALRLAVTENIHPANQRLGYAPRGARGAFA